MKLCILGCSGSIGTTAINNLKHLKDVSLSCVSFHTNEERAREIDSLFNLDSICFTGINKTKYKYKAKVYFSIEKMLKENTVDKVLNAIIGFDGVKATEIVTKLNISLALANKESIVCCGSFLFKNNNNIIPVDSEHSCIYHLLQHRKKDSIKKVIITCSGGPLLNENDKDKFFNAPLERVLKHPTWSMGKQITIDSASLANKGLEVIEASYLFNLKKDQISVSIHPQSIVHSLIVLKSNMLYSQLSKPDMSYAILSSISYSDDINNLIQELDFSNLNLNFSNVDFKKFKMLDLAYSYCLDKKPIYSIAYQSANEICVKNYIENKIKFGEIPIIVEKVLKQIKVFEIKNFDDVYKANKMVKTLIKDIL